MAGMDELRTGQTAPLATGGNRPVQAPAPEGAPPLPPPPPPPGDSRQLSGHAQAAGREGAAPVDVDIPEATPAPTLKALQRESSEFRRIQGLLDRVEDPRASAAGRQEAIAKLDEMGVEVRAKDNGKFGITDRQSGQMYRDIAVYRQAIAIELADDSRATFTSINASQYVKLTEIDERLQAMRVDLRAKGMPEAQIERLLREVKQKLSDSTYASCYGYQNIRAITNDELDLHKALNTVNSRSPDSGPYKEAVELLRKHHIRVQEGEVKGKRDVRFIFDPPAGYVGGEGMDLFPRDKIGQPLDCGDFSRKVSEASTASRKHIHERVEQQLQDAEKLLHDAERRLAAAEGQIERDKGAVSALDDAEARLRKNPNDAEALAALEQQARAYGVTGPVTADNWQEVLATTRGAVKASTAQAEGEAEQAKRDAEKAKQQFEEGLAIAAANDIPVDPARIYDFYRDLQEFQEGAARAVEAAQALAAQLEKQLAEQRELRADQAAADREAATPAQAPTPAASREAAADKPADTTRVGSHTSPPPGTAEEAQPATHLTPEARARQRERAAEATQRHQQQERLLDKAVRRDDERKKVTEEQAQKAAEERLIRAGVYQERLPDQVHKQVTGAPDAPKER